MYRRPAIAVLGLLALPRAFPQPPSPDSDPGPILKSTARVVQLDVSVVDTSGRPVHGLQQKDFAITDDGRARDIRIFAGEMDADTATPPVTALPPGVFSNRFGLKNSRIETAIVIDAIRRPEGLQQDDGVFGRSPTEIMAARARGQARQALNRLEPGQTMAIYAVCPELRVVQDYTSDPDRLLASLDAFVVPCASNATGGKEARTINALVPPMLSALREIAGRMSGASGRKSIVWVSQGYGAELNRAALRGITDETVTILNDADVPLYAVDARFNPTCRELGPAAMNAQAGMVIQYPACSQPRDASDDWMEDLAQATGGRAFSGGNVDAVRREMRDAQGRFVSSWGRYGSAGGGDNIGEALRFAVDDSRYAYELGFYVPDSELDGKLHMLGVTVPGKPKYGLRYRGGYTASASAAGPPAVQEQVARDPDGDRASALNSDEVGIDATIDIAAAEKELRVSLALDPATVTRTANHAIMIDETFTETDGSGKQLAKIQETVPVPAPGAQDEVVRYTRAVKLVKGSALLHVTIRDQATKRTGSLVIPIQKR
ncbi:MAG TPA: VWA domain-containing protein [Bryobacteraceae bacterium]|nr:VWA domain-containing protein [Bryobacteraceae bacterium]